MLVSALAISDPYGLGGFRVVAEPSVRRGFHFVCRCDASAVSKTGKAYSPQGPYEVRRRIRRRVTGVKCELPRLDRPAPFRDCLLKAKEEGVPVQVFVEVDRHEALLGAELRWIEPLRSRLPAAALPGDPLAFPASDRYCAQRKAAQQ